uniref:NR LBD domain-containing protein n=1 Tax=Caenorhabditis tropicalis TaxID=1561998 RepID=A0A1I7UF10_9PELO
MYKWKNYRCNMSIRKWEHYRDLFVRYCEQIDSFIRLGYDSQNERLSEMVFICDCIYKTLELGKEQYTTIGQRVIRFNISCIKSFDGNFIF